MIFAVDGRYSDVGAVGDAVHNVVPLRFDHRSSDYLGGNYLLAKMDDGCSVRIRKNYSSFLDERCIENRPDAEYAIIVERCTHESIFAGLADVPGFEHVR
jgi:hypothetical protein